MAHDRKLTPTRLDSRWRKQWKAGRRHPERGQPVDGLEPEHAMAVIIEAVVPGAISRRISTPALRRELAAVTLLAVEFVWLLDEVPTRRYPDAVELLRIEYEHRLHMFDGEAVRERIPWDRALIAAELAAALARPIRLNGWVGAQLDAAGRGESHALDQCWRLAPKTMKKAFDHWQHQAESGATGDRAYTDGIVHALGRSRPSS